MQTDEQSVAPPRPRWAHGLLTSSLVRYLAVGGLSFGVDEGLLVLLREVANAPLLLAATVAFWVALGVNFTLNRRWSFGDRDDVKVSFVKYLTLVGVNYALTLGIIAAGRHLGVHYTVAKAAATGTAVCWNYVAYRYWVFR